MTSKYQAFEQRKRDHIELALLPENQMSGPSPFDAVTLCHEALPDLNFNALSIQSTRFKKTIPTPFLVSSMTAGHEQAPLINRTLMEACAHSGWAMGVGSQRRELKDRKAASEWTALRRDFAAVSLFSNIGIAQAISAPCTLIEDLTAAIHAEALIIHCNPLQECIQPEGTPDFAGCYDAIAALVEALPIPIVIKETGCGFSKNTLLRLNELGVAAVDVAGSGGTHWGRIEGHRATDEIRKSAAKTFQHWGINTVQSLMLAQSIQPNFELWGSGGVRTGLDAAKVAALSATTIGMAKPVLEQALISVDAVRAFMQIIEYELKVALFCTGSLCLTELQEKLCP